jgi:hypothetical protein
MPFKVISRTMLTVDGIHPCMPPTYLDRDTVVDRLDRKSTHGRNMAKVKTREPQIHAREGWLEEAMIVPIYGQTDKQAGTVVVATQEVIDVVRRFSKKLDEIYLQNPANVQTSFMIGVLLCEDLDDQKKFYAAISGSWGLPPGWEDAARQIGCIPAPSLSAHAHMRNIGGQIMTPVTPGPRKIAEVRSKFGGRWPNSNWDEEGVNRAGNKPGTCAAQKMLQLAIKRTDTPRAMAEQWYDSNHGTSHAVLMQSCPTCQVNLTRMLKR